MCCCKKCGTALNNDNWTPSAQKKHDYRCRYCLSAYRRTWHSDNKEKDKKYSLKWRNKNREKLKVMENQRNHKRYMEQTKIMKELKSNGCAICGYNKCQRTLVFHHTNPKHKKFRLEVNSLARKNNLIADELNKCILLCSNCHGEIHTSEERNQCGHL